MFVKAAIRQGWVVTFFFLLLLIVRTYGAHTRQAIYLLPFVALLFGMANYQLAGKIMQDKRAVKATMLYFLAAAFSLVGSDEIRFIMLRDTGIISAVFISMIMVATINDKMIKAIFIVFAFIKIDEVLSVGFKASNLVDLFVNSSATTESYSFQFGLFTLYFLYRRDYKWAALSSAFILLAFKRIAILAFGAAMFTYYSLRLDPSHKGKKRKPPMSRKRVIAYILLLLGTLYFLAMNLPFVARELLDYFGFYDVSTNFFLKGRLSIQYYLFRDLYSGSPLQWLFGHGAGMADYFLVNIAKIDQMPHNDILKLQYDYGIVGMLLYLYAIWLFLGRDNFGIVIFVYGVTLLPTDNTLIYLVYQFVAIAVIKAAALPRKSELKRRSKISRRQMINNTRSEEARGEHIVKTDGNTFDSERNWRNRR